MSFCLYALGLVENLKSNNEIMNCLLGRFAIPFSTKYTSTIIYTSERAKVKRKEVLLNYELFR